VLRELMEAYCCYYAMILCAEQRSNANYDILGAPILP